ncbi:Hypothetical predicted protein [Olea europaea subsp. europaea]|uniref:Uncharacterized protein n=1 Tax=Olea europaea subsp. europaea TaxID=158383 RepID=A0A8S0VC21_OLEEU|nr:Hypothetical predicted protein [Olea europaea subsp. europaea]
MLSIMQLLKHEVTDFRKKNTELSMEINDVKEQLLSIKVDSSHKLNIVVRVQENIRTDLLEIKSELKFLSDSVTAMPTPNLCNTPDMPQTHQLQEQTDTIISRVVVDAEVTDQKHMDSCVYYICQLALYVENVKYKATTMDSHFQAVIKHLYPHFKKDQNVLLTDTPLINDVTGVRLRLSCP